MKNEGDYTIQSNAKFFGFELKDREFELIRQLVRNSSGIHLSSVKKELVRSRLSKRLRHYGFTSFKEYYYFVTEKDSSGQELFNLIDAISTNKTDFFREGNHFDFLNKVAIPELLKKKREQKNRRIRIWSAACSTGEEAYTLAMVLLDHIGKEKAAWDAKILAVDISTKVLRVAMDGLYEKDRLKDVPVMKVQEYFSRLNGDCNGSYEVKKELKSLITFRRMDLIHDNFPFHGTFDFIFCRNVMIYFDKETQHKLVEKFYNVVASKGYLFIGHSESLHGSNVGFKYVRPTIYQKI